MKYDAIKRKLKKLEELYPSGAPLTTTLQTARLVIDDLEQKVMEYENVLQWILENFDSEKSGLSDSEYHARMLELTNEALTKSCK